MLRIESVSIRFALVIGIMVALMVPLVTVMVLVNERRNYFEEAVSDVAQAWSGPQAVAGPALLVSLRRSGEDSDDSAPRGEDLIHMPAQLTISHSSSHEMRNRGIFKIPVFTATVTGSARFRPIEAAKLDGEIEQVALVLGVSDSRGVRAAAIHWNDVELQDLASAQLRGLGNVVQAELDPEALLEGGTATVELQLRGTDRFSVLPVGETTQVSMQSDWPDPSFDGRYLPDAREVGGEGFSASWSTHALSRGFPALVSTEELESALRTISRSSGRASDLGYSILNLNTPYRSVERSIKYGVLFIVMTMVSIVCIELVTKARFHIIQYGVVGAGLVLFFLTTLSLSEHVGFGAGYALAAIILAAMTVSYVWFVSHIRSVAITLALVLLVLYAALYLILQLNEFALLVGTVLLLVLLGALMFATKSLHHSELESPGP